MAHASKAVFIALATLGMMAGCTTFQETSSGRSAPAPVEYEPTSPEDARHQESMDEKLAPKEKPAKPSKPVTEQTTSPDES